jgi:hypothetical protein
MNILKTVKEDNCIFLEQEYGGITYMTKWRPYTVGDLPNRFGCLDDGTDKGGISEWFNYKGYTYVRDER